MMTWTCARARHGGVFVLLACALLLGACNGAGSRPGAEVGIGGEDTEIPDPAGPEAMTEAQLLAIAQLPGLYSYHRDVAVVCEEDATRRAPEAPFPSCDVARVDAEGVVTLLGLDDVRNAQRHAGERVLIVRRSLEMVVTDNAGVELRSLGTSFTSPHVMSDGLRVLALAHDEGVGNPGGSETHAIERVHAFTGEREVLVDDPGAYAPHEVPNSEDVVFVSGRNGLASLWLREADGDEVLLSNRAIHSTRSKGWAPVPVHELTWLPDDPTRAVYAARVQGEHQLWMLDLSARRAQHIGPGHMPALRGDGRMLVVTSGKSGPRVASLPIEVLPPKTVPEEALP